MNGWCHAGSCIAPRVTGRFGPGFWKLACLDMQLGFYDADPTLSPGTQAFTSYFLRPTQPSCPMSFLSLASYDSSCVEYLVHAHRAPHHSLALGSGYCLGIASSCQESSDVAFPGWTQHILLNNQSAPPVDASQEAKLQAFTAESCSQVAAVAGLVDTVIGVHHLLLVLFLALPLCRGTNCFHRTVALLICSATRLPVLCKQPVANL